MQNAIQLWLKKQFFWILALMLSVHFVWATSMSERPSPRFGDPLLWYLERYRLVASILGAIVVPRLIALLKNALSSITLDVSPCCEISDIPEQICQGRGNTLILDSNIWMNPQLNDFFNKLQMAFRHRKQVLTLLGPQFDEICNIKDRTPYASKRSQLSRLALSRIEAMQRADCLKIESPSWSSDPTAYADPRLLILIQQLVTQGEAVHFVSDDRELRIRARQNLATAGQPCHLLTVGTSHDLLSGK